MTTFGEALRAARLGRSWSQMELARSVGVSQPMISYWERDVGVPDDSMRMKLISVLGPFDTNSTTVAEVVPDDDNNVVDGFEPVGLSGFGQYPIDSLMIRTEHRTVHDILRRIEKSQMVLTPDFQRDFVWDELQQSRLIESVLMRIPLPVMYLAETSDGKLVVVDGLQRITTFWRFTKNDLALKLEQPELKGKRFSDLDMRFQNRIEDTTLTLYIIDAKVKEQVRLDIFERVNNGAPLTRQQMRNCIYNGDGTRWLRDRAASTGFAQLFSPKQRDELAKAMRDRELVNRFAAFRIFGWEKYRGEMDDFLRDAIKELNGMTSEERDALTVEFDRGIANNVLLFDKMAFRRHEETQTRGSRFNVALFDVMSTLLGQYDQSRIEELQDPLRAAFYRLLSDSTFRDSVAYGTNQRDRVTTRFTQAKTVFQRILGNPRGGAR